MKLKSAWYSLHPEQRKYLILCLVAALLCVAAGIYLGSRVLKSAENEPPQGAVTQQEVVEIADRQTNQNDMKLAYVPGPPPKGTFWIGKPRANEKVFTSRQNRKEMIMVAYYPKKGLDEASPVFPGRAVVTMRTTRKGAEGARESFAHLPQRSTPAGPAYLEAARAVIPDPENKRIIFVTVDPDPRFNGPQPELLMALQSLRKR